MGRPTNAEIAARDAAESETELPTADAQGALADALLKALERLQPAQSGVSADQLSEILESTAKSTRQALKPENARHPDISAFNPAGERDHPRPALKRKTFWANVPLQVTELTTAEIELMNAIEHTLEARNGRWKAEIKKDGGEQELWISFPHDSIDDRMDLPSMEMMLRELVGGTRAVDASSLAQRVAELEKQLSGK